jgi:hypothetical protein
MSTRSTTEDAVRWFAVALVAAGVSASCAGKSGSGASDSGSGVDVSSSGRPDVSTSTHADARGDTGSVKPGDATSGKKDTGGFVSHDAGADCGGRTGNPCGDGAMCTMPSDCQSMLCTSGVCTAPPVTCTDGMKDGMETDVDCGGPVCPACGTNKDCAQPTDCVSLVCTGGTCQAATDSDGVKNDSETDIDCGGALQGDGTANPASDGAPACAPGKVCVLASDCTEGVCSGTPVASGDGGVSDASAGATDAADAGGTLYCQPASPSDGVQNDSETDVDCGGATLANGMPNTASDGAPACGHGQMCLLGTDCTSGVCNTNTDMGGPPIDCPAGSAAGACLCQLPSATDGVKNGGETDVDCGGATAPGSDGAPACGPMMHCAIGTDCTSFICATNGLCTAPSPTDGVKNDSETDVDCGGVGAANSDGAKACADDKSCLADTDCLSGYCSLLTNTCVDGQSCKGLAKPAQIMDPTTMLDASGDMIGVPDPNGAGQSAGLDTCGAGEATDPIGMQKHESCCRSLLLPGSTTLRMDKYIVTSGRVRQFLESLQYDVRDWAIAQFDANFNPLTPAGTMLAQQIPIKQAGATNAITLLPHSNDTGEVLNAIIQTGVLVVDKTGVQGCYTGEGYDGAGTYWWDADTINTMASSPPRPFTQDYYDIKPMNCIPYYLAAAFCAWDGGRVMLQSEHTSAWGPDTYPWGTNTLLPNPYPGTQAIYSAAGCGGANGLATNASVNCTIDWANGCQGEGCQGDFYYYPSYVANIPNGNVPDGLTSGLDLTPYIAAPGRFFLDRTAIKSTSFAGTDGWQDMAAIMLELAPGSALTGGQTFCDQSGVLGPGESYNCNPGNGNGVLRASGWGTVDLLGGSWEGHGITENYCTNCWNMYRQYGKTGFRCVRPAEPAP